MSVQTCSIAFSLLPAIQADIEGFIAEGACRHGNTDNGWDMERACWACETADFEPLGVYVRRVALSEAKRVEEANIVRFLAQDLPELLQDGSYGKALTVMRRIVSLTNSLYA